MCYLLAIHFASARGLATNANIWSADSEAVNGMSGQRKLFAAHTNWNWKSITLGGERVASGADRRASREYSLNDLPLRKREVKESNNKQMSFRTCVDSARAHECALLQICIYLFAVRSAMQWAFYFQKSLGCSIDVVRSRLCQICHDVLSARLARKRREMQISPGFWRQSISWTSKRWHIRSDRRSWWKCANHRNDRPKIDENSVDSIEFPLNFDEIFERRRSSVACCSRADGNRTAFYAMLLNDEAIDSAFGAIHYIVVSHPHYRPPGHGKVTQMSPNECTAFQWRFMTSSVHLLFHFVCSLSYQMDDSVVGELCLGARRGVRVRNRRETTTVWVTSTSIDCIIGHFPQFI